MLFFYLSLISDEKEKDLIVHIYRDYYKYMAHTAFSIVGDKDLVEDVIHSTMLKLIEHRDYIKKLDDDYLKNLTLLIVKHKAKDMLLKKSVGEIPTENIATLSELEAESSESIAVDKLCVEIIISAIDSLDDIYREVCELKFLYDMKESEIASFLGITPVTVSTRIHRARKILAEKLRRESFNV